MRRGAVKQAVKQSARAVDARTMNPSVALLERLLGIAEAVAAYGDQIDGPAGARVSAAAREAVDLYWQEACAHPDGARVWRDEMFALLIGARPAVVG